MENILSLERKFVLKIIYDFSSLVILGIPLLILNYIAKPYERGFYCDDESIRYPYKDSTVSNVILYLYGFGIPITVIIANELYNFKNNLNNKDQVKCFFWKLYCELVPFFFGVAASQLITDTAKISIGRLRPHFIDVCQPNVDCSNNQYTYITNFKCKNSEKKKILDAHLSFMSGHASFSAFCMTYTMFYINNKMDKKFGLIKKLGQFLFLYLAIYTGFTRISDYKHHWSDVLIGWLQGTSSAILTAIYVAKLHRPRNESFYKPYSPVETESSDQQNV